MEITINLARTPFIDLRQVLRWLRNAIRALAVLSSILALVAYVVHLKAKDARGYVSSLETRIGGLLRERQTYQAMLHRPQITALLRETNDLNQIVETKALSWTLVMEELEAVLPNDVQVTAIEPTRDKDGSVTLRIRVTGPRDKSITLVKNLELSKRFYSPRIVSESASTNIGSGYKPGSVSASTLTQVDLLAGYDTGAPDNAEPFTKSETPILTSVDQTSLGRKNRVHSISDHGDIVSARKGSTLPLGDTQ